jgi:hypothetical protein
LGDLNITGKHLEKNEWLPSDLIRKTFRKMVAEFEEIFELRKKRGVQTLTYKPPVNPGGLLGMLLLKKGPISTTLIRMEKKLGRSRYGKFLRIGLTLLLIIICIIAHFLSTQQMSKLMEAADKLLPYVRISYILIIIIMIALARLIIGREPFKWAVKMLNKIISIIKGKMSNVYKSLLKWFQKRFKKRTKKGKKKRK